MQYLRAMLPDRLIVVTTRTALSGILSAPVDLMWASHAHATPVATTRTAPALHISMTSVVVELRQVWSFVFH